MNLPAEKPPIRDLPAEQGPLAVTGFLLIAIAALYLGQGIFVPLVLAVLVAFALDPVVGWLRRLGLPRVMAAVITIVGVAGLLLLIGYLIVTQLTKLAVDLPQYQQTLADKVRALQQSAEGGGVFERLANLIERLGRQIKAEAGTAGVQPIPVTIADVPPTPLGGFQELLGSLLGPLATVAIVTVFAIFLLLEREDLRDRFLKLVSRGDLRTSTKVINESAARVSRYLLVQFVVNASYGVIFGTALTLLGVPNAVLWGLFAVFLRYIPFVGTMIAVAFPAAVAFAVDPGWGMFIGVIGIYFAMELITTNAIEPRLYGSSTGLSALAVLVAAIFWATLWGPVGLILATPVTVCLVVLGRYIPQLAFLETLLGSEPVLKPEERLYQRLLAGNIEEAIEISEAGIKEAGPIEFYQNVLLPALRLAEADLQNDVSDLGPRRQVAQSVSGVIADVDEMSSEGADITALLEHEQPQVLALGGKTELDGAAAQLVARVAAMAGMRTDTMPPMAVRPESIGQLELAGVEVVCLTYLGPHPQSYVRYVARRVKRRQSGVRIVACLLHGTASTQAIDAAELRVDAVATSIGEIGSVLRELIRPGTGEDASREKSQGKELSRTAKKMKALATSEGWLEEYCTEVARTFDVPLAVATVADTSVHWGEGEGQGNPLTEQVVSTRHALILEDVSADKAFADTPFLLENGIQFYAGEPLVTKDEMILGALSIMDTEPRKFPAKDRERLGTFAMELMAEFERRQQREFDSES